MSSLEQYNKPIAELGGGTSREAAKRDLRAAFAARECFALKVGERVVIVDEHQPYVGVVRLRREGELQTFWTSDMAVAK